MRSLMFLVWVILVLSLLLGVMDVGQRLAALALVHEDVSAHIPLWRPIAPMLILSCCLALGISVRFVGSTGFRSLIVIILFLLLLEIGLSVLDVVTPNTTVTMSSVIFAAAAGVILVAAGPQRLKGV